MGIYTSNRYLYNEAYDWASEIPANEAYDAAFGCAHILADCQTNDMALFESTVYSDIAEVRAVQEGYGYVNENAFTDVIKKIVEAFKKLLAKIKGIFAAFIAKLTGAFKNGKDLVKKYEKQILKYSNWKDFKCKGIRKPVNDNILDEIKGVFKYNENGTGMVGSCYVIELDNGNSTVKFKNVADLPENGDVKKIKDMDSDDLKNWAIERFIDDRSGKLKITDYKELDTEVMDYLFEDADTIDGDDDHISGSYFSKAWIKGLLNESEKSEKEIKKFNKRLEDNINKIIDNLNKANDNLATYRSKGDENFASTAAGSTGGEYSFASSSDNKKITKQSSYTFRKDETGSNNKYSAESMQEHIQALQKIASIDQEVITKVTSEFMTVFKFALAQARKVWTAAAAWSSGVHKESVDYAQAVGESAAEQFYINMESI